MPHVAPLTCGIAPITMFFASALSRAAIAVFASLAVDEMNARSLIDVGALATLCDQRHRTRRLRPPVQLVLGDHVPDFDVVASDLEVYDDR